MKLANLWSRWLRFLPRSSRLFRHHVGAILAAANARNLKDLSAGRLVELGYEHILGREPEATSQWFGLVESGKVSRAKFIQEMLQSEEFRQINEAREFLTGLHGARLELVKGLPQGDAIVDLGGSCNGRPEGAMLVMGYPHHFKSLTIVELPRDRRHEIYKEHCEEYEDVVRTAQGPVHYVFTSMSDLSAFGDGTIDLVFSGESLEHITRDEADILMREVRRVLKPGGYFCLDTPNRAITRLQYPEHYINPDHKYEYTHSELSNLLVQSGFSIREAKGLCLAAESVRRRKFTLQDCIRHMGLFDDISRCYLLYYKCQKE